MTIATFKFWQSRWWHRVVLRHTVSFKEMPLPEFDSECTCGSWWFTKNFNWEALDDS